MGQIKFMTSLILISLFVIAVITFSINFAIDNETRISLADDSEFSSIQSDLEANVTTFYNDANTSVEAIGKTTISSQTEATEGGTAFKVGPWTALSMAKSSITAGFTKIFGADSGFGVFLTSFLAMLGIIMGFYIYKTFAGRNPD